MTNESNQVIHHQVIRLNYVPDTLAEKIISHGTYKRNPPIDGLGMSALLKAVEQYIPIMEWPDNDKDDDDIVTFKDILYVSRYECPCCETTMQALVDVHVDPLLFDDGFKEKKDIVEGLYKIKIGDVYEDVYDCNKAKTICTKKYCVTAEKMLPSSVSIRPHEYLPRRSYEKSPELTKQE